MPQTPSNMRIDPMRWYNLKLSLSNITPAIIETIVDKLVKTAALEASILDSVKLIKKKATREDNIPKYEMEIRKFEFFKGEKYWANVYDLIWL